MVPKLSLERLARLDQADLHGVTGKAGDVVEVELAHQVRAVVVHCLDADIELGGDLLGAVALGHELEDFAFAVGEEVGAVARPGVGDHVAEQRGDGGAEISAAIGDGFEALLELGEPRGLLDEAVGADLEHLAHQHGIFVTRKHQHADVRQSLDEAAEQIDAVEAGQFGVEHEEVGFYLQAQVQGALNLCLEVKPDLLVLDAKLPGLNGVDLLRRLVKTLPNVRVLVFSGHENPVLVREMLEVGAHGFVEKTAGLTEFKKGLETVANGGTYFGPAVAALLRDVVANPGSSNSADFLTDREREILQLVAESHSTKEIAAKLDISVKTVDNHRTNLMRKLNLHDVASLTRYAVEIGLIEPRKPL